MEPHRDHQSAEPTTRLSIETSGTRRADTEALVARYLELLASSGADAAAAMLTGESSRDAVLQRVAELRHLGFVVADPMAAAAAPSQPLQFGPYLLQRLLGRGGMGSVHLAEHRTLRRHVAVKCLLPTSIDDPQPSARFQREALALAGLRHEGIVAILDVGCDLGVPWYAMEYVDGPSFELLLSIRRESPDLPLPAVLTRAGLATDVCADQEGCSWQDFVVRIVHGAAAAVGHAHRQGLVHRDIKPGNLMLRADGRVVVVDFGLCRALDQAALTRAGEFLGSPLYAAPEHLTLADPVPAPTFDVWSLGVVLCELLTLQHPFHARSAFEAQRLAAEGDLSGWRRQLRSLPRDLATVCERAIDPEPRRRFADAVALADELLRVSQELPIATRRRSWSHRLGGRLRRQSARLAMPALVLVVAVLGGWSIHAATKAANNEIQAANVARLRERVLTRAAQPRSPAEPMGSVAEIGVLQQELKTARLDDHVRGRALHLLGDDAYRLGEFGLAESLLRDSVAALVGDPSAGTELAEAQASLALVLQVGQLAEAPALFAAALRRLAADPATDRVHILGLELERCRAVYAAGDTHLAYAMLDQLLQELPAEQRELHPVRIDALACYGLLKARNERIVAGGAMLDEAELLLRAQPRIDPVSARVAAARAEWAALAGRHTESAVAFDLAVELGAAVHGGTEAFDVLAIRRERAFLWRRMGRLPEAEAELRALLVAMDRFVRPSHPDRVDIVLVLAKTLRDARRWPEAVAAFEERWRLYRERVVLWGGGALDPTNSGGALCELAEVRAMGGDVTGAERDLVAAIGFYQQVIDEQGRNAQLGVARRKLGELLLRAGRLDDGEAALRDALADLWWAINVFPEEYLSGLRVAHAHHVGRYGSAAAIGLLADQQRRVRDRLGAIEQSLHTNPPFAAHCRGNCMRVLGEVQAMAGDQAAAKASLAAAVPLLATGFGADHPRTAAARSALADLGATAK